jgi:hypothetical protein
MAHRLHPADAANAAIIANAVRFDIALFIGRGKYAHASARTLAEARNECAPRLEAEHPYGRRALIYAIDANGRAALVTDDAATEGRDPSMKTYAKKFNAQRAARAAGLKDGEFEIVKTKDRFAWRTKQKATDAKLAPDPSREPPAKTIGKWTRGAFLREAALRGELPPPPDFSAPTHARFRNKLAAVIALAEAGDLDGLRAFQINPISSSPKAIKRYRDLCIMALEARK